MVGGVSWMLISVFYYSLNTGGGCQRNIVWDIKTHHFPLYSFTFTHWVSLYVCMCQCVCFWVLCLYSECFLKRLLLWQMYNMKKLETYQVQFGIVSVFISLTYVSEIWVWAVFWQKSPQNCEYIWIKWQWSSFSIGTLSLWVYVVAKWSQFKNNSR